MKFLLALVLVTTAVVLSVWLLPWWVTVGVAVIVLGVGGWFAWKLISTVKKGLKKIAEGLPRVQERLCVQPAGERFRGNGFSFTFPVPCEVSQSVVDDFEALMLKPALDSVAPGTTGLMVVSTIARDELKEGVEAQLDAVFMQAKTLLAERAREDEQINLGEFAPVQVGAFTGECRQIQMANAEKKIQGETVYLGGPKFSLAWALMGPEQTFQKGASQYREYAAVIERAPEQPVIDLPASAKSN